MTIDFGSKKTFYTCDVVFNIHAMIKDSSHVLRETSFPLAQIARLVKKSDSITDIVLQDGAQISIDMPILDLNKRLSEIAQIGKELDLRTESKAADLSMITDLFNSCVKNPGIKGYSFEIKGYMYKTNDPTAKLKLDKCYTSSIETYKPSESGDTCLGSIFGSNSILPIPFALFSQLYTHAQRAGARLLDLTTLTDPNGSYQCNRLLLNRIPRLYQETTIPKNK